MATKTHIVNLALLRIGVSQRVSDVDTEQTTEALSAKLIFDDERDFVLRDFSWPFARKYATPVLIDGTVDAPANGDWIFAYTYPNDCLFVRRVMNCQGRQATSPPP